VLIASLTSTSYTASAFAPSAPAQPVDVPAALQTLMSLSHRRDGRQRREHEQHRAAEDCYREGSSRHQARYTFARRGLVGLPLSVDPRCAI
jgi:hypothetical protein